MASQLAPETEFFADNGGVVTALFSCVVLSTGFDIPCYCDNFHCRTTDRTICSSNVYVFTVVCLFVCLFICLFVVGGVEVAWCFDIEYSYILL